MDNCLIKKARPQRPGTAKLSKQLSFTRRRHFGRHNLHTTKETSMVVIKVTDGIEARRFQVSPGEITFQQLQERINAPFPGAVKDASTLALRYRDNEGDLITLSSDEEFQELLSDLPSEYVLRLHIYTPLESQEEPAKLRPHPQGERLSPGTRRNPWSGFHRHLRETEALLDLLLGQGDDKRSSSEQKVASEKKAEPATSEERTTTAQETTSATETTPSEATPSPSETTPKEGENEEVRSKHPKKATSSESPCCCHLWELGGVFGPSLISPTVRYHVYYTPRSQASSAA